MLNTCTFSEENLHEIVVVVCEFIANSHGHCVQPEQQFESLVETQVRNNYKNYTEEGRTSWIRN